MSIPPTPDVTVVGAGGIGCALGHALRAGGVEVAFVETDEKKVQRGRRHGVGLDGRVRLVDQTIRHLTASKNLLHKYSPIQEK